MRYHCPMLIYVLIGKTDGISFFVLLSSNLNVRLTLYITSGLHLAGSQLCDQAWDLPV